MKKVIFCTLISCAFLINVTDCYAQKGASAHIGKNTPVVQTPDPIRGGHSYVFKTFNPLTIKTKVIVARKKPNGKYEVIGSQIINPGKCMAMPSIAAKNNEVWYVAFKCKAKILVYNNIEKIAIDQVDECSPENASNSLDPIPTRSGVRGTNSTTTTSTTTMDER